MLNACGSIVESPASDERETPPVSAPRFDLFPTLNYTCDTTLTVSIATNLDGSTTRYWTGVPKKVTATAGFPSSQVLEYDFDTSRDFVQGEMLYIQHFLGANVAAVSSGNLAFSEKAATLRVRAAKSGGKMACADIAVSIRKSTVDNFKTQGIFPDSTLMTIGTTRTVYVAPVNLLGYEVPVQSTDANGDIDAATSLSLTTTSPQIVAAGATSIYDWKSGAAILTAMSVGSTRVRQSLRGVVDSSRRIIVCGTTNFVKRLSLPASAGGVVGTPSQLIAAMTNCAGNPASGQPTWSSLDPAVATVNSTGAVSPQTSGVARIVAQKDDGADTLLFTVVPPAHVISIEGPQTNIYAPAGSEVSYVSFSNATAYPNSTYEWAIQWNGAGEWIWAGDSPTLDVQLMCPMAGYSFQLRLTLSRPGWQTNTQVGGGGQINSSGDCSNTPKARTK